ncbi:hypothetical protein MPSEU_000232800 [Mayamaea pseudoterrestris]|nr:hypothetical protein MPSEU_000232800 [Mayamaea pseudoterrestris]
MDEVNSNFGRLNMSASEWKPGGTTTALPQQQATRKISQTSVTGSSSSAAIKEFVPGQGWIANVSEQQQSAEEHEYGDGDETFNDNQDYHHDALGADATYDESTVPAGPMPPPPTEPTFRGLHSLGVSDNLWRHYRNLSLESTRQLDPLDPLHHAIPFPYSNAFLLEQEKSREIFGHPSTVFQVTNRQDGHLYSLRRFDTVRSVSPKIAATVLAKWNNVVAPNDGSSSSGPYHPSIVPLSQCFVAQRAVFFVHSYLFGAQSLEHKFSLQQQHTNSHRTNQTLIPEAVLWSIVTQLVSAIRWAHARQLAVRILDWSHVLVTTIPALATESTHASAAAINNDPHHLRVHISGVGILDALEFESRKPVMELQKEDLRRLGRLMLSLCMGTTVTSAITNERESLNSCFAHVDRQYSRDVINLLMNLFAAAPPSIADVSRALVHHSFDQMDATLSALNKTEHALAAEYDSGRALRLLLKLGFVNERPEFGPNNRQWSQSGDCYILTLFRDFVFHQADGAGYPVMDLGHVVTALNKLDVASPEQIVLASRDGQSLMVVTYADVARCLENAFGELTAGAVPTSIVPC